MRVIVQNKVEPFYVDIVCTLMDGLDGGNRYPYILVICYEVNHEYMK